MKIDRDYAKKVVNSYAGNGINVGNRKLLGKCVKELKKESNDQALVVKIEKIQTEIDKFDKKIAKKLNKFIDLNKKSIDYYSYVKDGKIKIRQLPENSSIIDKLKFNFLKKFKNDTASIRDLYLTGREISTSNRKVRKAMSKSLPILKKLSESHGSFFKKRKSVREFGHISTAIQATLSSNKHLRADRRSTEKLLADAESTNKPKDKFTTLVGASIASTLALPTALVIQLDHPNSFFNRSGLPYDASLLENEILHEILEENNLTVEERSSLKKYVANLDRSLELNKILSKVYDLDSEQAASNKILQAIKKLKDGESILLDVGYSTHATRLEIQKLNDKMVVKLHDPGGTLDLINPTNILSTVIKHLKRAHIFGTLKMELPIESFDEKGPPFIHAIVAITGSRKFPEKSIYSDYHKVITSLSKDFTLETKQKIQTAYNCFAQRIRANEKNNLGPKLYKKIRRETLIKINEKLLEECELKLVEKHKQELNKKLNHEPKNISEEKKLGKQRLQNDKDARKIAKKEIELLKDTLASEPDVLTPDRLRESRNYLGNTENLPSTFEDFYHVLRILKHDIHKPRKA